MDIFPTNLTLLLFSDGNINQTDWASNLEDTLGSSLSVCPLPFIRSIIVLLTLPPQYISSLQDLDKKEFTDIYGTLAFLEAAQ